MSINEIQEYLISQLQTNQFLSGGLVLTAVTSILYSLRGVPEFILDRIQRKIYFQVTIEKNELLYPKVEHYLFNNYSGSYRNIRAKIFFDDVENGKVKQNVHYEQLDDFFFIKKYGKYLRIYKERQKLEHAQDTDNPFYERFVLSGMFAKNAIFKFLEEINEYDIKVNEHKKSTSIFINNFHGSWDLLHDVEIKDINSIFIERKDELINDIDNFINSRNWHKEKGIPYKRGYGFFGLPGNGKTTLALSLARYVNRDVYILNLNELNDIGLKNCYRNLNFNSILILEDIDAVFSNKNTREGEKVSFSTLLNILDGAFYKEGVITIITSNHPEKLDPALKRKGRIDKTFHINNPTIYLIEQYLSNFYDMDIILTNDPELKNGTFKYSMVDIQGLCLDNINNPDKTVKEINKNMLKNHKLLD